MKYARVFLKGTDNPLRWVDVPLGNGAFAGFVSTVRMNGAVVPQPDCNVMVPYDEIKYMVEIETGTVPIMMPWQEGKPN